MFHSAKEQCHQDVYIQHVGQQKYLHVHVVNVVLSDVTYLAYKGSWNIVSGVLNHATVDLLVRTTSEPNCPLRTFIGSPKASPFWYSYPNKNPSC